MDNNKYTIVNDNGNGIYEIEAKNSNIHYYVNENKKTVAAVMTKGRAQVGRELEDFFDKHYCSEWFADVFYECELHKFVKNTYKGKAHCIRDDKFDLDVGMRIAREHMLADYYVDRTNCFSAVADRLTNCLFALEERIALSVERAEKFIDASNENYENAHK
jgi:hypothetical protein